MPPAFEPHAIEKHWYSTWDSAGYFQPSSHGNSANGKPFVITIPPPNVTGVLHLGHALQHTVHDCLLRYHRMKGDPTLVRPRHRSRLDCHGSQGQRPHQRNAGQNAQRSGPRRLSRARLGWTEKYGGTIISQMKALGCSYDWTRERFTMDEGYTRAVLTVFKQWYDKGLIYRGYRLVNWSPGAQSTVSDLEINYREVAGKLWHLKYPVKDSDEFIVVATTRPETMLGDTAVAVHPDDERYKHLHGKAVLLPLMNREIPIITDTYVDASFGSGAVKITPAHDPTTTKWASATVWR
jgi:valyl-tRNA synthetase